MPEMENNGYQPPKKISVGVRKDVSLSGETVCPSCKNPAKDNGKFCGFCGQDFSKPGAPRPRAQNVAPDIFIGKSQSNSGKGNLSDSIQRVVFIILLAVAAYFVISFVRKHYEQGEGVRTDNKPVEIDLYTECANVAQDVLAPLETSPRFGPLTLKGVATKAEQIGSGEDADRVRAAVREFSAEAEKVWSQREKFRSEIEQTKTKKPSTLSNSEKEQARLRDFAIQAVHSRWADYVGRERPVLCNLLAALGKNKTEMDASKLLPSAPCERCKGFGRIACEACKGSGMVMGKTTETCKACNGTGSYKTGLSKSTTRCPHCAATGRREIAAKVICTNCGNLGQVACPLCSKPPAN